MNGMHNAHMISINSESECFFCLSLPKISVLSVLCNDFITKNLTFIGFKVKTNKRHWLYYSLKAEKCSKNQNHIKNWTNIMTNGNHLPLCQVHYSTVQGLFIMLNPLFFLFSNFFVVVAVADSSSSPFWRSLLPVIYFFVNSYFSYLKWGQCVKYFKCLNNRISTWMQTISRPHWIFFLLIST